MGRAIIDIRGVRSSMHRDWGFLRVSEEGFQLQLGRGWRVRRPAGALSGWAQTSSLRWASRMRMLKALHSARTGA